MIKNLYPFLHGIVRKPMSHALNNVLNEELIGDSSDGSVNLRALKAREFSKWTRTNSLEGTLKNK